MNTASILVLIFLAITFVQSGYDKISDWNGNVAWLKEHFSQTFIKNHVPQALTVLLAIEVVAGVLCAAGTFQLMTNGDRQLGYYGAILSCVSLLLMLFGQRIAKDFDGARTIAIYFIPAVLAVHWLG